jgi:predicted permease
LTGAGVRTSGRDASRARAVLVLAEISAAVSLLVGAGLLARSFLGLTRVPLGLDPDFVQTGSIALPDASYHDPERRALFVQDVVARLSARGDVQSAAATFGLPLTSFSYSIIVAERDGVTLAPGDRPSVEVRTATPKFFATIGTPLMAGRDFTDADRRGSAPVVIINERAAALLWPGANPLGHRVSIATTLGLGGAHVGGEVVGLVGDIHDVGPAVAPRPVVYLSGLQCPMAFAKFVVKPRADAATVATALREVVSSVDPAIPVFAERPMRDVAARVVAQPRFLLQIVGLFAGVAVVLAAVGIYGVMAESVRARTREIGIRLALGATPRSTVALILRQATWLAVASIGVGLAIAVAESRLLAKFLFGIAPTDVATLAGVSAVTLAVAIGAAWLPARRAARVDPVTTLRGGE